MPIWRIFCSELNLLLSIRSLFRICSVITFRTCKTLLEFWTSKLPLMDYVFVSLLIGINMIYKNSMDHLTFNSTLDSVLYESSFYRVKFVYLIKIWVWINNFFFFICTCGILTYKLMYDRLAEGKVHAQFLFIYLNVLVNYVPISVLNLHGSVMYSNVFRTRQSYIRFGV